MDAWLLEPSAALCKQKNVESSEPGVTLLSSRKEDFLLSTSPEAEGSNAEGLSNISNSEASNKKHPALFGALFYSTA